MNRATKINVVITGMIFGLSGITHGCSETLQGNAPTNGFLINAIAAGSRWTRWTEGGEGAFTIIPNFLLTGILAMLVGLAIIVWSVGFVHRPRSPLVFLLLFVLLKNEYAARTIEVEERQQVITAGPYALVRHPMYTAMTLIIICSALALGSYWALIPAALFPLLLVARILNEEAVLHRELAGYDDYCQTVRYRLLPGVW